MTYHTPVMLTESVDALNIQPDGTYVDVTFGGGGHSREILKRLSSKGKLIAFDQDADALQNVPKDPRLLFVNQNFEFMYNHLQYLNVLPVNGILADLGVSSHQFDVPERGFSFRFDAELDMRMDQGASLTAKRVINTYSEEALYRIFKLYGEIQNAHNLAHTIVVNRSEDEVNTVFQLKDLIKTCVPKWKENQYLAQVFQALRIEVNRELHVLQKFLLQSAQALTPGGRLVVLSYHSLEDRLVKHAFRNLAYIPETNPQAKSNFRDGDFRLIEPGGIAPDEEEIRRNPRARSARLRILERR